MFGLHRPPAFLVLAASLVALEAIGLIIFAVAEAASFAPSRAAVSVTSAVFFAGYGLGLLWCVRALIRGDGWARSPVILTQLIQLGLAWSFRGGDTTLLSVGLMVVSIIVMVGVLHPTSLDHLLDERSG